MSRFMRREIYHEDLAATDLAREAIAKATTDTKNGDT